MPTLASVSAGVGGEYEVSFIAPDGTETPARKFTNLVTDVGLNFLPDWAIGRLLARCRLGTGNATRNGADTDLGAPVGPFVTRNYNYDVNTIAYPPSTNQYIVTNSYTYFFPYDAAYAGQLIAEVGTFDGAGGEGPPGDNMFSTALIKNSVGDPAPFVIPDGATTKIIYRVNFYIDAADKTGDFIVGGSPVATYTIRPYGLTPDKSWRGSSIGAPLDYMWYESSNALRPVTDYTYNSFDMFHTGSAGYVPFSNSHSLTAVVSTSQMNNVGDVGALMFGYSRPMYRMTFTPKLTKNASVGWNFSGFITFTWGRV